MLRNIISIEIGDVTWTAVPNPSRKGGISGAISALFTTHYTIHPEGKESDEPLASVSYYPVKDEILIQIGERHYRTVSNLFGPTRVAFENEEYMIHEKITGRFSVLKGNELIVEGRARFRSIQVDRYPEKLEPFVAYLSVGLLIRILFGELGV